jgi:Flp pilus assembly protein TadG
MIIRKNIFRRGGATSPAKASSGVRHQGFWRNCRGSMTAAMMVSVPAAVICGGWAVDQGYVYYRYQALEQAAASAALAGHTQLSSYYQAGGTYSTTSMSTINTAVSTILSALLPSATYGNVITTTTSNSTSGVQIGTWNPATQTFTATTTSPNAVKATALATVANGNPIHTLFGGLVGRPTVDLTVTAVSSYGNGLQGAGGFNTIIVNDLSQSFSSEMANQRAADIAILNCISNGTNGNGSVGLTSLDGDPYIWNAAGVSGFPTQITYNALPYTAYSTSSYAGTLVKATTANVATMTTFINNTLNYCGTTHGPPCSGSNMASGLYSAIKQLQAAGIANTSSNIILITDSVPSADVRTYTASDGLGVTPSSSINSQYGWLGCTILCSDANLWTAAQAWAAYAGSLGINISTVYYSGDTTGQSNITAYSNKLASLVSGQGIALVAPSKASISASFATFCSSMGTAVKSLNGS